MGATGQPPHPPGIGGYLPAVTAQAGQAIITLAVAAVTGAFYMGVGIKYLFTNKPMSYEHLSGTHMVSTLAG